VQRGWLLRDGQVLAALEVADRPTERLRGLLGRTGYEGAMLLPHTRSVHTFFMKFPLDVAVLDGERRVLAVKRMPHGRLCLPRRHGRSVLEAEAGSFERWGLAVGHQLELREAQ
jgi:hypothetical protein